MGRLQKKYFLSILILLFFSLSHGAPFILKKPLPSREKRAIRRSRALSLICNKNTSFMGKRLSQAFAQRRNLRMDEQDKVTVFILPKAGETKETIDIETLKAYGGEVLKSGLLRDQGKGSNWLLSIILPISVQGINFIKRPDRPRMRRS